MREKIITLLTILSNEKIISIITVLTIVLGVIWVDSKLKRPYEYLANDSVVSIEICDMYHEPPIVKTIEDRETINEIVDLFKIVETTHIFYIGKAGDQMVRFTLLTNTDQTIEADVCVNSIKTRIVNIARKANYEVSERLYSLGNRILEDG